MKLLFIKKLYLWPRFRAEVVQALDDDYDDDSDRRDGVVGGDNDDSVGDDSRVVVVGNSDSGGDDSRRRRHRRQHADIVELSIKLTPHMKAIQSSILVAMNTCMSELKAAVPYLDTSMMTLENGLFQAFDLSIRRSL